MTHAELAQLQLLARIDALTDRLTRWVEADSDWEPLRAAQALVRRVLGRVESLRIRLEAPLIVATFGGTGTGKSTLVNALVGRECTPVGRQRPTTRRPVVLAHTECEIDGLGLPLEEVDVICSDAPVLRDVVLLDCPDPDTSETDRTDSNLHRLRALLPHCDVLIYTTTQQKYRSARVLDELGQAATGCRLLFVQTHADIDSDIRDDWQTHLAPQFEVPEMFFVDSVRALDEQRQGLRPTGEFGRLLNLVTNRFEASERIRIRRANLLDLLDACLQACRTDVDDQRGSIRQLQAVLEEHRESLSARMAARMKDELSETRNLWERRLLSAATDNWGFSPFSSLLRLYSGLGALIASTTLFRARTSAQIALIGAIQGTRWLGRRREQKQAQSRIERLGTLGLDDATIRETQIIVDGHVRDAHFDPAARDAADLDALRDRAAEVEQEFVSDAGRRIDEMIRKLAVQKTGFFTRAWYELLFLVFVGYLLFRIGYNFFYEFGWQGEPILAVDFYFPAGIFLVLWSGLLVMSFTRRLRRGLSRQIDGLAADLAATKVQAGLFPHLERSCQNAERECERLEALGEETAALRSELAVAKDLGTLTRPVVSARA